MNEVQRLALIRAISEASNKYGDKLLTLMDAVGATSLRDVTGEQAERFCREHGIKVRKVRDEPNPAEK